ncbi:DUF397 domain-containing protein [Streptomyces albus subsp. chlorinus]|uniref:DUF397 domain-containing protein n=1 Tax=Streptomyces albus TaxID=1888 RepID=UPI0015707923|nr:DUF397 domain-containing protein [Streptomyces albus]NSC21992.1 DUF397 domain-containing protein [Streptomyces albus subsp. chlorinus]
MNNTQPAPGNGDLAWFKSSYSSEEGGACLEVAYTWHKSSYSGDEGGACLEVSSCPHAVHVRDSKNPTGPTLALSPTAWAAFTAYAAHRA